MKYLGVEIKQGYSPSREEGGAYKFTFDSEETYNWDLEELKRIIRRKVLPTYQPTKTLEWLEQQTGLKWRFEYTFNTLYVLNNSQWEECYCFSDNTAYVISAELGITAEDDYNGHWLEMTPREFIEKIAKGEWI